MATDTSFNLTIDEFRKYKSVNKDLLPELRSLANNLNRPNIPSGFRGQTNRNNRRGNWKKQQCNQPKLPQNWLLKNKLNRDEDEKLYSQMRTILNKLSDSNFNKLANELINLEIVNETHLSTLVDLIFRKAICESQYCVTYASLCTELSSYYIEVEVETPNECSEESEDLQEPKNERKQVYFREILLNKCQSMFEEAITLDKEFEESENESIFKFKDQILSCMIFIGELFNKNLLTTKIVYSCFYLLFAKLQLNKAYTMDCICLLMKTVGKKFSREAPNQYSTCFEHMIKLMDSGNLDMRDKFGIMDVMDLQKKEGW